MAKETILVVDDSKNFATTVTDYMLKPLGYNVLYGRNGAEGLQLTQQHDLDLILLDMNMPRMSGLEMLNALRQTDCEAPVIFMTMHGSEGIAVEAFRLGVRDYLPKPFTPEDLQGAIDRALTETRLRREKELLERNLIISETIRQTVVTLSHYINNHLMVLNGSIELLQGMLPKRDAESERMKQLASESRNSGRKIGAVLRVLQKITKVDITTYHGQVKMIDIEAALARELKNLE